MARRFKFIRTRVQHVPARQRRFRPQRRLPSDNLVPAASGDSLFEEKPGLAGTNLLQLCANRTQKQIFLRTTDGDFANVWSEVCREEILDFRTGGSVTPCAFEQALTRLATLGLIEVRGIGDRRELRRRA